MKNIVTYIVAAALCSGLLSSCESDNRANSNIAQVENIIIDASITKASGSNSATTAGKSQFEHNDEVSIFVWTGALNYTNLLFNNVAARLNYDAWVTSADMKWKNLSSKHYLSAISPATDVDHFDTLLSMDYESGEDVLYANAESQPTTSKIELEFAHVMSRLDIELNYVGFGSEDDKATSITIYAIDNASINYFTGDVSIADATKKYLELELTDNKSLSRIMVPQSGITELVINIGEKNYIYSGDDIELEGGHYTKCNFTITKHNYELDLNNVTVKDWNKQSGSDYDFTVDNQ